MDIRVRPLTRPAPAEAPAPRVPVETTPIARRAMVARPAAPVDSLWYRAKRAVLDVICNIEYSLPWREAAHTLQDDDARRLAPKLQPGDVLLRRTEGTTGNFFIPSWWKHAAVYAGDGKIVEATFHGVVETTVEEFFAHGDHAMVLRAKELSPTQRLAVARFAEGQIGKPYDFDMNFKDLARLSCTELAAHALAAATKQPLAEESWFGAVVADGFRNDHFEEIFNSAERSPQ